MFRHPKYYKELRKRNRDLSELQQVKLERSVPQLDQVISDGTATAPTKRAPGPGLKLGEMDIASSKPQAPSSKLQASSKPEPSSGSQASSDKHQALNNKRQASSHKLQAP